MAESNRGILVFSKVPGTLLELLGKARQVASGLNAPVMVALLGASEAGEAADLGKWGADCVYAITDASLEDFHVELYTDALAALIADTKPEVAMLGTSKHDYELGPRLAQRLHVGCVSACIDFTIAPDTRVVEAKAMIYTGLGTAVYRVKGPPAILLAAPGVFAKQAADGKKAQVIPYQAKLDEPKLKVLETKPKARLGKRLEEAKVVIDVGQGVREQKDLVVVQPLVDVLHGELACTRPVSSERGWFPDWLGLSGRRVSPRLCIALGVSGAIQHMVGIRGSEVIVAVDNNPDSAMLVQADYGVIADLYEFAPALAQEIKKRELHVA